MSAKEDKGKEKGIKARLLVGKFPLGDRFEFFTFITCEMHVGGTLLRRGPFQLRRRIRQKLMLRYIISAIIE
jgi:hypothetical protein